MSAPEEESDSSNLITGFFSSSGGSSVPVTLEFLGAVISFGASPTVTLYSVVFVKPLFDAVTDTV